MGPKRVAFVGAGAVGRTLGVFFQSKGVFVSGYYSLNKVHAEEAVRLTGGCVYESVERAVADADWIGLTVNDDAIKPLADSIASSGQALDGKIFFHTSGAHSTALLAHIEQRGGAVLSLHPLQAFKTQNIDLEKVQTATFSVEGTCAEAAREWLKSLGLDVLLLTREAKVHYHTAAVMASNFLVPLMRYSLGEMGRAGIAEADAFKALRPLIEGTLENIEALGVDGALTGPVARGDVQTIETHLAHLEDEDTANFYKYMSLCALSQIDAPHKTEALASLLKEAKHETRNCDDAE
ncbi:Rossmann-like and DUF2520 domain-containing protein [Fusibacter sp. JL298sf-3]